MNLVIMRKLFIRRVMDGTYYPQIIKTKIGTKFILVVRIFQLTEYLFCLADTNAD